MPDSVPLSLDLKDRRVLVVDDERLNRRLVTGVLAPEGCVVIEAESGEQALARYAETRPDLVLLDVMLGGINGFETCRQLRATYGVNAAPVIFITAKTEAEDIIAGLEAGGVDYLQKPIRPREALARIRTHLANRVLLESQRVLVEQLSRANAAKNKFLGMCAHDLRNPLASVRGLADMLREGAVGDLQAPQRELVDAMHGAVDQMLVLVNDLLDVATIEAGELKLVPARLDFVEFTRRCVLLNAINASPKRTQLAFDPGSSRPILRADGTRLKQVLDNLLSNAIKFSPPASTIRIALTADATHVSLAVQDEGPGIPEGEHHRLFKDFSQLSVKPTGGEKSTGLGLAICRKIIEAHGGTITATNLPAPARGCVFCIRLPLPS